MTLADSDYPFLSVFWSMMIFFFWIIWIWLLITVFADIFRRRDMGGGAKTLWIILVIILPYLGVFIYLITQGGNMADRSAKEAEAYQAEVDERIKSVAGSGGAAAEIERAKNLLDSGAITQAEFDAIKQKALA
jgi:hypothetical protein